MSSSIEIKKENRNNIYRLIYRSKTISLTEIAQKLSLSYLTVLQLVSELKEQGLVDDCGSFHSTGGRKAKMIGCVGDARLSLGLDITQNHISLVLLNMSAEILSSIRITLPYCYSDNYFLAVKEAIARFLEESGAEKSKILGMGISLPAIIESDHKTVTYAKVIDAGKNLFEKMKEVSAYPVLLFNDANAGGYAESWVSDYPGEAGCIYLSLSNSVGGAFMIGNHIFYGASNRCGEFGHMTIIPDGEECYCGKKGCLDAYCNATVLTRYAEDKMELFFEHLASGDRQCREVFHRYLDKLAIAINNLRMGLDCDIILGGYVGSYLEPYLTELRELVRKRNPFDQNTDFLKVCSFKSEAAAVGGALYYIELFIKEI